MFSGFHHHNLSRGNTSFRPNVDPLFTRKVVLVVEIKEFILRFESQLPFLTLTAQTDYLLDLYVLVEMTNGMEIPDIFRTVYLKMMFAGMGRNSVLEEVSFGFSAIVNI
jgi:hypothetical protein